MLANLIGLATIAGSQFRKDHFALQLFVGIADQFAIGERRGSIPFDQDALGEDVLLQNLSHPGASLSPAR